jgi:hypothetical protein
MKLFRWAAAGASVYVIYKYSIGKKAKGENVFDSPKAASEDSAPAKPAKRARVKRTPRAK